MNTNEVEETRRNTRTMFLIKDLLEHAFPHKGNSTPEEIMTYNQALGMFIAHAKDWNPGVEEIGNNLLCRYGNEDFQSIAIYNGPLKKDNILNVIDIIIGIPVSKQRLGSQARKNLFTLSEHILKHNELGRLKNKLSNKLFALAGDIEGADSQY